MCRIVVCKLLYIMLIFFVSFSLGKISLYNELLFTSLFKKKNIVYVCMYVCVYVFFVYNQPVWSWINSCFGINYECWTSFSDFIQLLWKTRVYMSIAVLGPAECRMCSSNGEGILLKLPGLNNIQVISMVFLAYLFSLGFPWMNPWKPATVHRVRR